METINTAQWINEAQELFATKNPPATSVSRGLNENGHLLIAIRVEFGPFQAAHIMILDEQQARAIAGAIVEPFNEAKKGPLQ